MACRYYHEGTCKEFHCLLWYNPDGCDQHGNCMEDDISPFSVILCGWYEEVEEDLVEH